MVLPFILAGKVRLKGPGTMKTNRRRFISAAAMAGGSAATLPLPSFTPTGVSNAGHPDYYKLDKVLKQPVLKRTFFPAPVIMETTELLQDRTNFICRVRSTDGAEGISIGQRQSWLTEGGPPVYEDSDQGQEASRAMGCEEVADVRSFRLHSVSQSIVVSRAVLHQRRKST